MPKIVVLGAGVSGLTSAYLLSQNKGNVVTVVAKHMPGDYDIEFTSPWAGANVLPMATDAASRWERRTWPEMKRLATEVPEAGIHFQKTRIYRRPDVPTNDAFGPIFAQNPWYRELFDNFREVPADELPPGTASGNEFTSVCINTAIYLPWLLGRCLANGVVLKRAVLGHVSEAASLTHAGGQAEVIVNASGLLACKLGGVMDKKVYAARGQIVLVRNEFPTMVTITGRTADDDEVCYIMMRAAGGGTILGGSYQRDNWDPNPDPNLAVRIMDRVVELCPEIAGGKGVKGLDVIRHGVGLRPGRDGGVRIEKEVVDGVLVVHNYGHGGWGYQGSFGCAERVVELVGEALGQEVVQAML